MRESPALEIAHELAAGRVGRLLIVEPHLKELPCKLANFPNLEMVDLSEAIARADVVVILVAHNRFRALDRGLVSSKVVIDTVGLLNALEDA
jgi:UDP-N-acetyl-D-mannosaminuronic acid dehydrogenase